MNNQNSDKRRNALMNDAARYRDRYLQDANDATLTLWACDRGHHWDDAVDAAQNIRCMNCASHRREVEMQRLHGIAQMRGGALLSPGRADIKAPPSWRCAWGHVWDADIESAQRSWCAECGRTVFSKYR
jgi:hypothetical protein